MLQINVITNRTVLKINFFGMLTASYCDRRKEEWKKSKL